MARLMPREYKTYKRAWTIAKRKNYSIVRCVMGAPVKRRQRVDAPTFLITWRLIRLTVLPV